jgi:hypothetical protein
VRPPQYIDHVEQLIGLAFFAEKPLAEAIRTIPEQVSAEDRTQRTGLYVSALRLLAESRRKHVTSTSAPFELTPEQYIDIRDSHADTIATIRQGIMGLARIPPPPDAKPMHIVRDQLGVSKRHLSDLMTKTGVVPIPCISQRKRNGVQPLACVTAADTERLRLATTTQQTIAAAGDMHLRSLQSLLQTTRRDLMQAIKTLGISLESKRSRSGGNYGYYINAADTDVLQEYFGEQRNIESWVTIGDIARIAMINISTVRTQIIYRGYSSQMRSVHQKNPTTGRLFYAHTLPQSLADRIIHDLRIIVPAEYMTVQDIAHLRRTHSTRIRQVLESTVVPMHTYSRHGQTFTYLDGAGVHAINRLLPIRPAKPTNDLRPANVTEKTTQAVLSGYIVPAGYERLDILARQQHITTATLRARLATLGLTPLRHTSQSGKTRAFYKSDTLRLIGVLHNPSLESERHSTPVTIDSWRPKGRLKGPEALFPHDAFDAQDISAHTGAHIADVQAAIEQLDFSDCKPPVKINKNSRVSLHYSGRALQRIVSEIAGLHQDFLQSISGFPTDVIAKLLWGKGMIEHANRYNPRAYAILQQLKPPQGMQPLAQVATDAGMSEEAARAFLASNFGRMQTHTNPHGKPETFIHPSSVQLLLRQKFPGGPANPHSHAQKADQFWLHKAQVLQATGTSEATFEAWLKQNLDSAKHIDWRQTKDGRVLPHFKINFLMPYIKARRRNNA